MAQSLPEQTLPMSLVITPSTSTLKGGEVTDATILSADIVANPFEEGANQLVVTFDVGGSTITDYLSPTLNMGPNGPSRLRALTNAVLGNAPEADPGAQSFPEVLAVGTTVQMLTRSKVTQKGATIVVADRYLAAG